MHPLAPEHEVWGRKVRVARFARGYRILYEIHDEAVWVLRVRAPKQRTLKRPGPGSAYREDP